jgi:hypothetical protein
MNLHETLSISGSTGGLHHLLSEYDTAADNVKNFEVCRRLLLREL